MVVDAAFKGLEGVHEVLGILWIIMLIWFVLSVRKYKSNPADSELKGVRRSGMAQRILGGLAIIMGIVLVGTMKPLHSTFTFNSTAGVFLIIGIVFAIIAYFILGEGMAMRLVRRLDANKSKSLMMFASLELLFSVLTIIFMLIGAMI